MPITIALLVVLGFLILSYRQTIKAYPTAGGAYIVTRDNFGLLPAQVAGVALLTDYVLTVSVSVAAGTAALASAFPALVPFQLWLSIGFVVLIAAEPAGRAGVGRIFAVPTYFFIVNMAVLLVVGVVKMFIGSLPVQTLDQPGLVPVGSTERRSSTGPRSSSSCTRSRPAAPRSPASRRSRTACPRSRSRSGRTPARRS